MQKPKFRHPWRQAGPGLRTTDPVVNSRGSQFSAHLDTLPPEERRRIEAAERAFVSKADLFTSSQQSAARDYAAGMVGTQEDRPTHYRGFIV